MTVAAHLVNEAGMTRGRFAKVRVSAYENQLIEISSRVQEADAIATLQRCRSDLNQLIQRVMKDFSEERIFDQCSMFFR